MPKARVTRKGHARPGEYFSVGDVFTATKRELEVFADRLEEVAPATKPRKTKRQEPVETQEVDNGDLQADSY